MFPECAKGILYPYAHLWVFIYALWMSILFRLLHRLWKALIFGRAEDGIHVFIYAVEQNINCPNQDDNGQQMNKDAKTYSITIFRMRRT